MWAWLIESDVVAIVVVLACCLLVWQRFTTDRWKHRFEAIGSPLIKRPPYRVLFLLVLTGVLVISVLPEAAFVLPALDAVGLDLVTILVALELRHYLASVARTLRIPTSIAVYRRAKAHVARGCRDVMRTNPILWLYGCMWLVIWIRTLKGAMSVSRPAQI
jgi:hypothetical protein